jgi:hypothetical protein
MARVLVTRAIFLAPADSPKNPRDSGPNGYNYNGNLAWRALSCSI